MYQYELIESSLSDLLPILNSYISKEYAIELKEYLSHAEYGIVYEDLCEMVALFKIPISLETFKTISKLGQLMEYNEDIYLPLLEFVKK